MTNSNREFDIVLQGATGFTGRLAAKELVRRSSGGLRVAVAGRNETKVTALAEELGVPGIVADGLDAAATCALAARARVVLSCAGPFALYGDQLVASCAAAGTHYADLTGELPWITRIIERHHESCTASGTTLIPCSGFDSVPTDIAVHSIASELDNLGQSPSRIRGFFRIRGGLNGGTLHSGIALGESGEMAFQSPDGNASPAPSTEREPKVFPIPSQQRWAAPFLMAPVNEWVTRRSSKLLGKTGGAYPFHYTEHLSERRWHRAKFMSGLLTLSDAMLSSATGRSLLRTFGPKPGQGPSEKSIAAGFARLVLIAGDLDEPTMTRQWDWSGDPSNLITIRCLVQTGLALANGEATRGGVLTPVAALGNNLRRRLLESGAVTTSGD
ncbi:MAG: saccharopine dehydrogenase NADP-binding domain-containing protein [Planctomycetota bacterium]|nr:saccharopine dehydrogenase NADP-binding domain-containing protein [Planctomycetota bacterium]